MITAVRRTSPDNTAPEETTTSDEPKGPRPFTLTTGDDLPTGRKAEIKSMTGRAQKGLEDALAGKDAIAVFNAFRDLVQSCLVTLDGKLPKRDDVLGIWEVDWSAILLRIRRRTYPRSGLIAFDWRCAPPLMPGGCGHQNECEIDMDQVTYIPPVAPQPFNLPHSGKACTYEPATARSSLTYIQETNGKSSVFANRLAMFKARGVRVDGEIMTDKTVLDDLPLEDSDAIMAALSGGGGVDSSIEAVCAGPNCGRIYRTRIELLPGFFFPAAVGRERG